MESGPVPAGTLPRTVQGFQLEDGDVVGAAVADKAAIEFAGDGDTVHALGVRDIADHFAGVEIQNHDVGAVRDVQAAAGGVRGQVIPEAVTAEMNLLNDVITGGAAAMSSAAPSRMRKANRSFIILLLYQIRQAGAATMAWPALQAKAC